MRTVYRLVDFYDFKKIDKAGPSSSWANESRNVECGQLVDL
jgi:hypothetical protein